MNMHIRSSVRRFVDELLAEEFAALDASTPADPFLVDNDCLHPQGHDAVMMGRHFVCVNCSKVFE